MDNIVKQLKVEINKKSIDYAYVLEKLTSLEENGNFYHCYKNKKMLIDSDKIETYYINRRFGIKK